MFEIKMFILLFVITIPTLKLLSIINHNKQSQLLKEVGYKTTGKLVSLKKYIQRNKGGSISYYYVGIYEYYSQGNRYNLKDINYEFVDEFKNVDNELGREVEVIYLQYKPKVSRTKYQLDKPDISKFEITFILIVSIPLLIGVIFSIIYPQDL